MNFSILTKMGTLPIINKATTKLSVVGLKMIAKTPELALVGGIVAGGACIFMACRETIKAQDIINQHKDSMDKIHEAAKLDMMYAEGKVTDECSKGRDTLITYSKTTVELMKNYAPAVILGAVSLAAILYSHGLLKKRYLGVVAAYNAVSDRFSKYREAVVADQGEDADYRYLKGVAKDPVVETTKDEKGKKTSVVKDKKLCDCSQYSFFFDEHNPEWVKNPEVNRGTIYAKQMWANDILKTRGFLFMNEVRAMFHEPETNEGACVGWVLNGDGDGYVDFGIFQKGSRLLKPFIQPEERSFLLDLNVDGIILDKITENARLASGGI